MVLEKTVWFFRRKGLEVYKDFPAFAVRNKAKEVLPDQLAVGLFIKVDTGFIDKRKCAVVFNPADKLCTIVDDRIIESGPRDQLNTRRSFVGHVS